MPSFEDLDAILSSPTPSAAFDHLIAQFRDAKEYALAFEATLMRERHARGLPLIQTGEITDLDYQNAVVAAARETGRLFLANNQIERAWPYFRAISEPEPIRDAIDRIEVDRTEPGPNTGQLAVIAFQEGVHPRKGLELMLAEHGMCRAITAFGMTAVTKDREACIALLAANLHAEIVRRLGEAIESHEGTQPSPAATIPELITGRDWLFGEWDYYVDTSHLLSVIPYATELTDRAALAQFADLCAYGRKLSPQFHQKGVPPFEDQFEAYGHYIAALLDPSNNEHIDYFRHQAASADPELAGDAPARVLAKLLLTLGRTDEALAVVLEQVYEDAPYGMPLPSALQLCYTAKDFGALKTLARERGDLLSYTAGALLAGNQLTKNQ